VDPPGGSAPFCGLLRSAAGHLWPRMVNRLDDSLRHQTLSTMPSPYSLHEALFFSYRKTLKLKLVHSLECARGVENGFLNQELCLPKPGFSELQQPSIENTCSFTSPATSKRDLCRVQKSAVAEGKEIQQHWMVLLDATKVLRWWSCQLPCSFLQLPHTRTHTGAEEIFSRSYNVLSAASHVLISVALGLMRLPTAQLCGSSQLLWYGQMSTMQHPQQWTVSH
jgi:hypothetical protein